MLNEVALKSMCLECETEKTLNPSIVGGSNPHFLLADQMVYRERIRDQRITRFISTNA